MITVENIPTIFECSYLAAKEDVLSREEFQGIGSYSFQHLKKIPLIINELFKNIFNCVGTIGGKSGLSVDAHKKRKEWYNSKFIELKKDLNSTDKKIFVNIVCSRDWNGYIYGQTASMFQYQKVLKKAQKSFAVYGEIASTNKDIHDIISKIKSNYPDREIAAVNLLAHTRGFGAYSDDLRMAFSQLDKDTPVILSSCKTVEHKNNGYAEYLSAKCPNIIVAGSDKVVIGTKLDISENRVKSCKFPIGLFCDASNYVLKEGEVISRGSLA
ncbi:MAG: hypothetical protein S4CHLAM37_08300 [Chlamydiia bacterium]|nr:hypothetical protein [Chlamydiia bacterium]